MLPVAHRLRDSADFRAVLRDRGTRRAAGPLLVVYVRQARPDADTPVTPVRVGFVVSKAVGNAVVRHRTQRRLRHLVAARLDRLPAGARVVIRANPAAAEATSADLAAALDRAFDRTLAGGR
ncbi:ribonuclease P protein component [Calidifontibacter sp. DB0510]|uniref:Ribonuclease P protein component n=1 Tax=Metallococcus carri TaxID=1656884 RepID=A0A967B7K0_9MICO|nr:ribonuclease P protein component [Metallococcus carri]NHN56201.1 ribonuclease P protein component [Metallococcus carri]NOP38748.1 ribonuclease P protein component [Calidifontibacter sp. DB2511S]